MGRRGYAVIGGKYGAPRLVAARALALGWRSRFASRVLALPVFLPYAALVKAAFDARAVGSAHASHADLHNFNFVFFEFSQTGPRSQHAAPRRRRPRRSAPLLAFVIAYLVTRQAIAGHRVLGFLATAPVAVPGIVLGVGLFLAYTQPAAGALRHAVDPAPRLSHHRAAGRLPAAAQSAFRAVHPELEEASRILGAHAAARRCADITAPLVRSGADRRLVLHLHRRDARTFGRDHAVHRADTKVISVVIYDLNESGDLGAISVLGLAMLVVTFAVVAAVNRLPGAPGSRLAAST